MIRNRLKELMIERGLKASRLATDIPNLSRNTINTTANNNGKMIQLETIDSLCEYLEVTPQDFFEYLPFDVDVSINADNDLTVKSAPNNSSEFTIAPFYLNLYLKKIINSVNKGITQETFELSIICKDGIKVDNDPIFNSEKGNFLLAPSLSVVLGNPPFQVSKIKANEFVNFWEKELTPGFQEMIKSQIRDEFLNYFKNNVLGKTDELDGWELLQEINITYNFDISKNPFKNLINGITFYTDLFVPF